jgi:hypothetical protein
MMVECRGVVPVQRPDRIFGVLQLTRVGDDEGGSCLLAHTSSLKHLRYNLGDLGRGSSPPESEEPPKPALAGRSPKRVESAKKRRRARPTQRT